MSELPFDYRNAADAAPQSRNEDEENDTPGRILTVEEFIERLRARSDIFGMDKNNRLRKTEIIMACFAMVAGILITSLKPAQVPPDFYQRNQNWNDGAVTVRTVFIDRQPQKTIEKKIPRSVNTENRRTLRHCSNIVVQRRHPGSGSGIGSILSRVAKTELFMLLSSNARGKDADDGDIFGKNGFANGVDVILAGKGNGLKPGGRTATGRRGYEGIGGGGSDAGQSGFGGGGLSGTDGLIDQLMPADPEPISLRPEKYLSKDQLNRFQEKGPGLDQHGDVNGGRSKLEVMRVVMQNIGALRYAYNRCLREKPGIKGKITIRFAIDEFGNVIHCEVVSSSIDDSDLESTVTGKIMRWKFDRIDKPGDITEVVYPFVFST